MNCVAGLHVRRALSICFELSSIIIHHHHVFKRYVPYASTTRARKRWFVVSTLQGQASHLCVCERVVHGTKAPSVALIIREFNKKKCALVSSAYWSIYKKTVVHKPVTASPSSPPSFCFSSRRRQRHHRPSPLPPSPLRRRCPPCCRSGPERRIKYMTLAKSRDADKRSSSLKAFTSTRRALK